MQKIDKRVLFDVDTLDTLAQIMSKMQLDKSISERDKLGMAINELVKIKQLFDENYIDLDKASKERVQTMLGFGSFASKEDIMKVAIEKLFEEQREQIINKIANL